MTQWYQVETNGKRPAWLTDIDIVRVVTPGYPGLTDNVMSPLVIDWSDMTAQYYIPADHWAVAPLRAGYEPWPGGEHAPADWDGGSCMMRNGAITVAVSRWTHDGAALALNDIIGYRKRAAPAEQPWKPDERTVRAVCDRLRAKGLPSHASDLAAEFLPPSEVEQMARAMYAASIDGTRPWTDAERKLWLNSAQWAYDRGARL